MQHRRTLLATTLGLVAASKLGSARADDPPVQFHADLDAAHESPANQSQGTGRLEGTLDKANKVFSYTLTYKGLSGPVTAAHLHGPAEPGQNAGVVVPLQAPLTSPIKGKATLDDKQVDELTSGKLYVNLHTAQNPNGELRGQVLKDY